MLTQFVLPAWLLLSSSNAEAEEVVLGEPVPAKQVIARPLRASKVGLMMAGAGIATMAGTAPFATNTPENPLPLGLFIAGYASTLVGLPLATGAAIRASNVQRADGLDVSRAAGWLSWACMATMVALVPLSSDIEFLHEGPYHLVYAEGALALGALGAGYLQYRAAKRSAGGMTVGVAPMADGQLVIHYGVAF